MNDAMVTARMPYAKKEQAGSVLKKLGTNASSAINELFDYVIAGETLPFGDKAADSDRQARLAEALAWADGVVLPEGNRFASMTDDDIKNERLAAKGLL